jgi:hypothetical protein
MITYQDKLENRIWNPDKANDTEYIKVIYRIRTNGYGYPDFYLTDENRKAFNEAVSVIFDELGFHGETSEGIVSGATIRKEKSYLYLHPQMFEGILKKNEVMPVAKAITGFPIIALQNVDLYETYYDLGDKDYRDYLSKQKKQIDSEILQTAATKRGLYYDLEAVVKEVSDKFKIRRIGEEKGNDFTFHYVTGEVFSLIKDGKLVSYKPDETKEQIYIRTEKKVRKKPDLDR